MKKDVALRFHPSKALVGASSAEFLLNQKKASDGFKRLLGSGVRQAGAFGAEVRMMIRIDKLNVDASVAHPVLGLIEAPCTVRVFLCEAFC